MQVQNVQIHYINDQIVWTVDAMLDAHPAAWALLAFLDKVS